MAAGSRRRRTVNSAAGASASATTSSTGKQTKTKSIRGNRRKQQSQRLINLLTAATKAAYSFHSKNDLMLLPSQSLALESLLSSTCLGLRCLLLSLSLPSSPPPLAPPLPSPPQPSWFHRFLVACSADYDPRWTLFFRMSKPTFALLLSLLSPSLLASHPLISPDFALGAALFRLAHGASYKAVARRFGLESSADACRAFYTVCKTVNDNLGNLFELRSDLGRIVVGFGWISLPNCCGVLGFGRFEIDGELLGKNGSLLVQALVDSEGKFLDISAGWPNSIKPEIILRQTKICLDVEKSSELLNGPSYELSDGISIPQYILGDSCFPLLPWLITPYVRSSKEDSLSSSERDFNAVHCRAMGLVSTAFGRVRLRWQLLAKPWKEESMEFFPFVIVTSCLLHNFLIKCSEPLPEDNLGYSRDEDELPSFRGEADESGRRVRDALAEHLSRVSLRR